MSSARKPGPSPELREISVPALKTTREINSAPSAKAIALIPKGTAMPMANRNAPIGGPTSWLSSTNAPCMRELPMPRSSRCTTLGRSVLLAESANVSAVPRTKIVARTRTMLTAPVTIVKTSTPRTNARAGWRSLPGGGARHGRRSRRRRRRKTGPGR